MVSIASNKGWTLHQLDVKFTFLNGPLDEDEYVYEPTRTKISRHENKLYWLKKTYIIYGLKQAP